MKRSLLTLLLLGLTLQLFAANYYWVGGGGNWSDLNHWRLDSASGSVPSIVPSAADNVFFDSSSGFGTTTAAKTVTLDADGFCNNMTWSNVPNNPVFNTANVSFTVEVRGDIIFSPNTTYSVQFDLKGGTANTLTTGGNALGGFTLNIDKPGGSLTITDSLVCTNAASVVLASGAFNAAGKKLFLYMFRSPGSNARSIDISNSNVTATYSYEVTGANKTVNAAGSVLNALNFIYMDSAVYNEVTNGARDANHFYIYSCTFSTLTFTYGSYGWDARIHNGNTADTIRFMGTGSIGSNNNVNVIIGLANVSVGNNNTIDTIICAAGVSVGSNNMITRVEAGSLRGGAGGMGGGNTVGYWKHDGQFTVSGTDTNTVDSLLLTPGKIITFSGTFNVNKYLELNGTTCDAFSEVSGDSVSGSLNFGASATAVMNNMILTGLKANGPITPLSVTGIDNGGNAGFTITPPASTGTTLYWVGGSGDWNDRSHWSTSSGGASGACVPYVDDDVVFDANSGLGTSGTITTSSSTFCHDMTWANVGTVTFSESASYKFNLYGSLVMDPSVTLNAVMEIVGDSNASITTNGTTIGALQFIIAKTNGGEVTLTDDWSNPTGGTLVHRSGGLDLSGRTVSVAYYTSTINSARSLDITNATLNFTDYDYRGTGKTIASTGSHITTSRGFAVDGLTYPWVDVGGSGSQLGISGTTFGQLSLNNTSATTASTLGANNTVRRMEFKGRGSVLTGNTIDTLILADSRNYDFSGTSTIVEYLKAQSTPCSGLSEIKGNPTGTLAFSTGAVADMSNIYMEDMTATGPITPIAFNGADAGNNSGWNITVTSGSAHYWVGGAGDWNDGSHWSATSGGTGGTACVPTVYDDVYFDANSFTATGQTVTINNGNAYCHNMSWAGAANNPTFSKSASWQLEVWGDSLITTAPATFNLSLTLKDSNATYMRGGSPTGSLDIYIDKPGSGLTLLDNYSNTQGRFFLTNGTFDASGRSLNFHTFTNSGLANASSVDISNSTLTLAGAWAYGGTTTNHALNTANSTITTQSFDADGFTYNKVNVNGAPSNSASFNSTTIDSLVFTAASTTSQAGINGTNNIFNYVEYKGSGGIYGTNNTIDTLVFFPGDNYILNAGTNTTITGEWFGSGTPCHLTQIYSSSTTSNATVTKTSGTVNFDYVRLRRITAAGAAAPFIADEHTDDQGNNTNWTIAPYNGVAPIYGLGPDTALLAGDFPYTLTTDGFFGAPGSQYTWSDSSTEDSLIAPGPGTYGVTVNFVDGCSISDQIALSLSNPLPVTLSSFTARAQHCQAQLSWRTTYGKGLSHFAVERSTDGRRFTAIGTVNYTAGTQQYDYMDRDVSDGTSFYRLKLVELSGAYQYSTIASVHSNCQGASIQVYPTVTSHTVQVNLPEGYEQARLYIINATGARKAIDAKGTGTLNRVVSLNTLPAGAYLLQVVNDGRVSSFRIVKE